MILLDSRRGPMDDAKTEYPNQGEPGPTEITPGAAMGSSVPGLTKFPGLPVSTSVPLQDLRTDRLLSGTQQVQMENKQLPTLAGIPLVAKLGQGGMGAVYLGVHPRLQTEVAVKVLPFHLAETQPELVERFYREARIAAQIQSPYLVSVQDVNEERGLFYIVMEYVPGKSAGDFLKECQEQGEVGLPESLALDLCIAASKGLAAAHARGIIHRDLKPDNILIPQEDESSPLRFDEAKLADLGLARSESIDQGLTASQIVMGTLGFLAPEQAMDAKTATPAADVFGMAATLYALLCGRPPFAGESTARVLMATLQEPPTPVHNRRPDISVKTVEVIEKCLAKDPTVRPQDARAFVDELSACRAAMVEASPAMRPTMMEPSDRLPKVAPPMPDLEPTVVKAGSRKPEPQPVSENVESTLGPPPARPATPKPANVVSPAPVAPKATPVKPPVAKEPETVAVSKAPAAPPAQPVQQAQQPMRVPVAPARPAKRGWVKPTLIGAGAAFLFFLFIAAVSSNDGKKKQGKGKTKSVKKTGDSYGDAIAEGDEALGSSAWKKAEAAFGRALKAKKDDQRAHRGLVAAKAGPDIERMLSEALKALEAKRFEQSEEILETIEWHRDKNHRVIELLPKLPSRIASIRKRVGHEAVDAITRSTLVEGGKLVVNGAEEARFRWAKGLIRATGAPDAVLEKLDVKVPDIFRMGGLPDANILAFSESVQRMNDRLKQGDAPTVQDLFDQKNKDVNNAVNWRRPFVIAAKAPAIWDKRKDAWKFGVRLSPEFGKEQNLRQVIGWLSFMLSGGKPQTVVQATQGETWAFSNIKQWGTDLKSYPPEAAMRALRRDPSDLRINLRFKDWIRVSDNRDELRKLPWDHNDKKSWAFVSQQARDLEEVALKSQVRRDHLWIRGRFFPIPQTKLHERLEKDSPILRMNGFRFLPKESIVALCASSESFFFSSFMEDFFTRLPIGDAKDVYKADDARRKTVGLAFAALKACGPQGVAGFVPAHGGQPDHVMVVADLRDDKPDLDKFEKSLKKFMVSGELWDVLTNKGDGRPQKWKPTPVVERGPITVRGIRAVHATAEIRYAVAGGRMFLTVSEHGKVIGPLINALDRGQGKRADSIEQMLWFKQAMGNLPRHAGVKLVINAKPGGAGGDGVISFFSRVLDYTWDSGLRLPVEHLKDLKPEGGVPQPPVQRQPAKRPEKRPTWPNRTDRPKPWKPRRPR